MDELGMSFGSSFFKDEFERWQVGSHQLEDRSLDL
jgi:hypothetical protein